MLLPDANLLLYAYNTDAPQHAKARKWLESVFTNANLICLSWQTITAFIRISTNLRAFPSPLAHDEAIDIIDDWLAQPQTTLLLPTTNHWTIFRRLIINEKLLGPVIMDAHLAALAIEHNAILATADRDFERFKDLKIINPLIK